MATNSERTSYTLSEFLMRKQEYIFDTLYDITHDKNLSRQDFTKLQKLVTDIKGLSGKCEASRALQTRMASIWSGLMKSSKHYRKNPLQLHLNLSEWFSYWSDFVIAATTSRDWPDTSIDKHTNYTWHKEFIDFVFDVLDQNNDDVLSEQEYISSLLKFGVSEDSCQESYCILTKGLNGRKLNRDLFKQYWFSFITSEDPTDPGNYLFGDPNIPPRSPKPF